MVIRLSDRTKMALTTTEIRNDMFQFGVRVALRFLQSKFWEEKYGELYGQAGPAFRIGVWVYTSQFYGEDVSVPFTEAQVRSALMPEPEHGEVD